MLLERFEKCIAKCVAAFSFCCSDYNSKNRSFSLSVGSILVVFHARTVKRAP